MSLRKPKDKELESYIESHIEEAIEKEWIQVYLQTNIRGLSKRVCGAEALSRWIDPVYGMISPGEFIPVLEKKRKIQLLDRYVMETICRELGERRRRGQFIVPISMNFSRLDFDVPTLLQEMEEIMEKNSLPRNYVHIEITESAVMENEAYMKDTVRELHTLGYKVWMDDFGSGYSSLNLLKEFEFDTFKIDMRFLSDMGKKSLIIISSILYMAKEIGIHTVAEGVETEEQYRFLKVAGCERMQGYYFARPEPMKEWFAHTKESCEMETEEDCYLYDEIGFVNIISPVPFDLERSDSSPSIHGFETGQPVAVMSEMDGVLKHLNFTKPYRKNLLELGYEGTHQFQDLLNDRSILFTDKMRDIMDLARKSGRIEAMDFLSGGRHCQFQTRLVARKGNKNIFLVRLDILSNIRRFQKNKEFQEALSPLYTVYDMVFVFDLKENLLNPVYVNEIYEGVHESSNLRGEIEKFVENKVYPKDKEACWQFLNPDTMAERVESAEKDFILAYFRSKNRKNEYVWKRFVLIRSHERSKQDRVIFGIHTLNMDKVSMMHKEDQQIIQEEDFFDR